MKTTYKAIQITKPGTLELVERKIPQPKSNEVLIEVEACGVCGADISDIQNADPNLNPPRVPGHEVVGRIVALGNAISSNWKLNQRVGIGRLGGHCNECAQCRGGNFQLCKNQSFVGASADGGYAEMMIAKSTALVSIPEDLDSYEAAPILCAGIATFNALKKSGAEAGDTVVIVGLGGLGHMAIQYARRMGFRVVVIGRGSDVEKDAYELGAHIYIDSRKENIIEKIEKIGGAQAIVTTITDSAVVSSLIKTLVPQGKLMLLGAGKDPLQVSSGQMVVGERSIQGSITGTPFETEKALNFSLLTGAKPRIEIIPFERAGEAYQKLLSGDVKFRIVLSMKEGK